MSNTALTIPPHIQAKLDRLCAIGDHMNKMPGDTELGEEYCRLQFEVAPLVYPFICQCVGAGLITSAVVFGADHDHVAIGVGEACLDDVEVGQITILAAEGEIHRKPLIAVENQ